MRLGPFITALIVACIIHAVALPIASAQETAPPAPPPAVKSEYDRLVDEALSEFDAGHFEEALSAFEQAYKVKPSARAMRGVAKALFELRSYARCVRAIDRAFASDVDPLTGSLRADLESLKARALRFVGEAIIEVVPETATVVLDGQALEEPVNDKAASPSPRVVDVGPHTLEVSAPDHDPQRRRFEVHGGEVTRVVVRLDPVRVAPPRASSSLPGAEGRTLVSPLALTIAAVVASTGAVVGSSLWFVDRGVAVDRCNEAAGAGAQCANADSIEFQRNVATLTLGLSGAALIASAVAVVFVLRGEKTPAASPKKTAAASALWWTTW